ncbi:hypothetical protein BU16DRAFT_519776 [Lophium mytilinum]|uniref:Rhodopsin domain-containing protein n=1 Tax=Lophium mytilinum TaxID=390894 RepID=A0A6A6Q961_9PEZI|nr:hypothetical protein BU16DRAFT_519776 [Lophium mytilinum]
MDPSHVDPAVATEQSRQNTVTVVTVVMTFFGFTFVALRIVTRQFIVRNVGADDWMSVAGLVLILAYMAEILALRPNGMGYSGATLELDQMINLMKLTLGIEITYYCLVYCIKMSILLFYLRIAAERIFQILCKATMALLSMFVTVCIVVCLVQCLPLHKMWDLTGLVHGRCLNTTAFFYSTSGFNIVTDIWMLALPLKTLWTIQRPKREKIALFIIFGMGIFSTIASIIRLYSIRIFTESKDPFYDSVQINLWSIIEVNIGIMCACIPSLKPLISGAQRERARAVTKRSGYTLHSRDKSGVHSNSFKGSREGEPGGSSEASPIDGYKMDSFVAVKQQAKIGMSQPTHGRMPSNDATPRAFGSSQEQILAPVDAQHR